MQHLKQWWATYSTVIGLVVTFLTPSINAWVGTHPLQATTVGAAWAIITHLLPSPVAKS
jgi:hypothetical protein